MRTRSDLLDNPVPQEHVVQLYGTNDGLLADNVARYLREGLKRGNGLLVIASTQHRGSFVRALGEAPGYSRAVLEGRLVFLDAEGTLKRFLVDGEPDQVRFQSVIGEALEGVRSRTGRARIRAYGEMVGVLWSQKQYAAALRLEELWNQLLVSSDVSLFCGYPVDPAWHQGPVDSVLSSHTHSIDTAPEVKGLA
jgi:MEDS: MEthanogen/methylotroph, DcmR Sensory domain